MMNVLDMNIPAKRLLLGGVAVLGVVALAGCGGGGGMQDDGKKMDPPTPKQLSLADLKAGASVPAGTYTISGDETERAAILAALGALDSTDIPAAGLSDVGGIKLRCAGTGGCGFEIEDGTFTVTGTIEVAATDGTFPSDRQTTTSTGSGGGGGGGDSLTPDPPADPVVSLSRSSVRLAEGGAAQTVTVTLKPAPTEELTLSYSAGDDPEVSLSGLTMDVTHDDTADTLTIPAGVATFDFTLTAIDNNQDDDAAGRTLTISLSVNENDEGFTIRPADRMLRLTVFDQADFSSIPEATASFAPLAPGATTATVTITLDAAAPQNGITVNYRVGDGDTQTATVDAGSTTVNVPVNIPAGSAGQDLIVTLLDGAGYTIPTDGTQIASVMIPQLVVDPTPSRGVLGAMDQAALNTAIDGVTKPVITGEGNICGTNADCVRIVNKLEAQAKAYAPLSDADLALETVAGVGTYRDANSPENVDNADLNRWVGPVGLYQIELAAAITALEGAPPPHTPDAAHIASVVNAAINVDNFVGGENRIASGFGNDDNDAWGIWIKEGDTGKLYYWHPAEGTPTAGTTSAAGFPASAGYAGTAKYDGGVDGYGHYTDSSDSNAQVAGRLDATMNLSADFGEANGEILTGTISGFTVNGETPGWEDVTLTHDYGVRGVTTAANVTGNWRSDFVYDVHNTYGPDGDQTQPESIRGRVVLDFTGTTTDPGKAAGVFEVNQAPPSP